LITTRHLLVRGKNTIHNFSAGASYVLAIGGFEYLAREIELPYSLRGCIIFVAALYSPGIRHLRGLLQRALEIGIFSALLVSLE
jgi:hypothetical protein